MRPVSEPKIAKNGFFWKKGIFRDFGSETGRTVPFMGQNEPKIGVEIGSFSQRPNLTKGRYLVTFGALKVY